MHSTVCISVYIIDCINYTNHYARTVFKSYLKAGLGWVGGKRKIFGPLTEGLSSPRVLSGPDVLIRFSWVNRRLSQQIWPSNPYLGNLSWFSRHSRLETLRKQSLFSKCLFENFLLLVLLSRDSIKKRLRSEFQFNICILINLFYKYLPFIEFKDEIFYLFKKFVL